MKEYGRPYNMHEDGLYVKIYNGFIEVQSKMFNNTLEMEIYYCGIEIEIDEMNIVLFDSERDMIGNIFNVKRIWDMR